ncbi:response regulator [Caldimonas sp. KR1-144]|uniref:response regulator n=1 Tax=Caldimonas sp. KR1-144 TaxID=3400911 RepID=UPI003C0F00DE
MTSLADWPAGPGERRLALAVALASTVIFLACAPFAQRQLAPVWAFIPIYESALVITDLITAVMLLGQCLIGGSAALLALACGYLFTAAATTTHALSFPGLFAPAGLIGAGPQSTAWIYMFWHGGFPLFVIAYALLRGGRRDALPRDRRRTAIVAAASAAAVAAALGAAAVATAGQALLPPIMSGNRYTPAMVFVVGATWCSSLVALALLAWQRRLASVLDLWLAVVLCAWLFDVGLSAVLNAGRFDLGFYAGRAYGLAAATFVLARLLLENGVLHARLVHAHARETLRSAELGRVMHQLQSVNAELSESNRRLEEQGRFKSEFLANMSHELRTPLNAIIGFSEMLKNGMAGAVSERQRSFAGYILDGGHHLLALINDILDLSKIEAGRIEIEPEPLRPDALLHEVTTMVTEQARKRGIGLELVEHEDVGLIDADRRRIKQVLLNLLSNAVKFSAEGAQVRIDLRVVARERAASGLPGFHEGMRLPLPESATERFVEISVSDSGIGIAPQDIHKLFKPFTQIANAVTRNVEGTGLGLVIVHRLVELHGGAAAVTSEAGRGSCFTVWLPCRPEERAQQSAPAAKSRPVVLVIEDHHEAALLMAAQLEALGLAVRRVASAEDALALADEFTPHLITLDIILPGMDGWEFLAKLKGMPAWAAVPVVVVSVAAEPGKGFSLGASLVLQKPIEHQALAKGLERLGLVPNAQRECTVLVVDDDAESVELLSSQLRQRRYTVLRALGGREGIELARRFRPDLIALDLEMPGVSGFDVVEALKADPSTAHIPIVVVTAQDLSAGDRLRLNGQIQDIVGKSQFDQGRFIGEVQRAIGPLGEAALH